MFLKFYQYIIVDSVLYSRINFGHRQISVCIKAVNSNCHGRGVYCGCAEQVLALVEFFVLSVM